MKFYIIVIFFLFFIFYHIMPCSAMSREASIVFKILDKGAKKIKNKYKLRPVGNGVSMPGGPLRELSLSFVTNTNLSKDELRNILIFSANELINIVNNDSDVLEILYKPPFGISNVEIIIYNQDEKGYEIYHPDIDVASISNSKLKFFTSEKGKDAEYKSCVIETYEEAMAIINNS